MIRLLRCALVVLLFLVAKNACSQGVNHDSLKELVPIARNFYFSNQFEINYTPRGVEFRLVGELPAHTSKLTALEKRIADHPDDLEAWFDIVNLIPAEEADRVAERALEVAKQRQAQKSDDPEAILQLGQALLYAKRYQQAERYLRRAADLLPNSAECKESMGIAFHLQAIHELVGGTPDFSPYDIDEVRRFCFRHPPTAIQVDNFTRLASQGAGFLDEAVRVGSRRSRPYVTRAIYRALRGEWLNAIRFTTEPDTEALSRAKKFASDDDWQNAATIATDNPRLIAFSAFCLYSEHSANSRGTSWFDPIRLPTSCQSLVDRRNEQLEKLYSHEDPLISVEARCFRAYSHLRLDKDLPRASTLLRDSLKILSDNDLAFNLLCATLFVRRSWGDLQTASEAQLVQKDSSSIRHCAAIAAYKLGQFDRAESHLRAALNAEPKSCRCNLALASVLLRRYEKKNSDAVRELLRSAAANWPSAEMGRAGCQSDEMLLNGLILAFEGDVDTARRQIKLLQDFEPSNENARKIAKALEK